MPDHPYRTTASWALIALLLIQFVPLGRINPPETSPVQAPEKIVAILKKSCFNCHSFQTSWNSPVTIAPLSWLAAVKVSQGRKALNFSEWGTSDPTALKNRMHAIRKTVFTVSDHEGLYYALFPESRPTPDERSILLDWIETHE
ncbi:MAG: hypothetical protein FJZ79_01560 [Chlorobi bacterium]|nr:hypothetical protein [Chlorobiota bacterium]